MEDLQQKKIKKLFAYWDTDGNGFIEKEDWIQILDRRAHLYEWTEELHKEERIKADNTFAALLVFADTNDDGRVSWDEFSTYFAKTFPASENVTLGSLPPAVQISAIRYVNEMDVNRDGVIEAADYVRWFVDVLGGDEAAGKAAFAKIDVDNNGSLSTEELQQAVAEFYLSADPNARGNSLFG